MASSRIRRAATGALHHLAVALGSLGATLLLFLILPLMQAITAPAEPDLLVRAADTASLEPPPPVKEPEPEEQKPQEQPQPQMEVDAQPLDLSQLELALGGGGGDGWGTAEFRVDIDAAMQDSGQSQELFSMADLDQKPRVLHQPGPTLDGETRKAGGGTVYILFVVDPTGRVENPIVHKQLHPALDRAALSAVKQWKFEPGRRNGQAVRFRMRVPITFPEGK